MAAGAPYYERFLKRFPTIESLADAEIEDVLRAWEGLGFYRRARNLHATARAIVERHAGRVPSDIHSLETLPGVGPYTAGAVASIAFGERVPVVDGNVRRVLVRLYRIEGDPSKSTTQRRLWDLAESLVPRHRPGAFNQALMELGATVCVPDGPACPRCPLEDLCLARRAGVQDLLPRRVRARVPKMVPVVFGILESDGRVLLVRRPDHGLLAGLWALPGGEKALGTPDRDALVEAVHAQAGVRVRIVSRYRRVDHTFSHRRWRGAIYRCHAVNASDVGPNARWIRPAETSALPLVPFHRRAIETLRGNPSLEDTGRRSVSSRSYTQGRVPGGRFRTCLDPPEPS